MSIFCRIDDKHIPLYRVMWVSATPHFCGEEDCVREGLLRNSARTGRIGVGHRRGARQDARAARSLARRNGPAGRRAGMVNRDDRCRHCVERSVSHGEWTDEEGDQLEWRDTYFILFQQSGRPTLTQVEAAIADATRHVTLENLEADEDGMFESLLVQAPDDHAALEISYETGDAVIEQSAAAGQAASRRGDAGSIEAAAPRRRPARRDALRARQRGRIVRRGRRRLGGDCARSIEPAERRRSAGQADRAACRSTRRRGRFWRSESSRGSKPPPLSRSRLSTPRLSDSRLLLHACQRNQTRHDRQLQRAPAHDRKRQRAVAVGPRRRDALQVPRPQPGHQAEDRHHAQGHRGPGRCRLRTTRSDVHVRRHRGGPLSRLGRLQPVRDRRGPTWPTNCSTSPKICRACWR